MKQNKSKIVTDAIAGSLIMLSILIYIILGLTIKWWHPGWILIVGTIVVVSIVSIITNAVTAAKALDKSQLNTSDEKKDK